MIHYKCGDVVLLPFPFTDLSAIKQRPGLVISSDWYNENNNDAVVTAITSHIPSDLADGELLLSENEQMSASLPKPSVVRAMKIVTIDQRLIRKIIGCLNEDTVNRVKGLINRFIGSV
jgi:mRNA interferase MazF